MTPRGIRNCNPLNIRRSKDQWKGLAEAQNTIRTIISRGAPESENNTEAYINNVSKLTGILPDEPLGIPSEQPSRWIALGAAMAIQENGTSSLDYFAMLRGWELCRQDAQSGKL